MGDRRSGVLLCFINARTVRLWKEAKPISRSNMEPLAHWFSVWTVNTDSAGSGFSTAHARLRAVS
jgi:hypothetical protein